MLSTRPIASETPTTAPAGSLRYDRPAERWFDGLPIGNGRLGGMVFGGGGHDRIQLSESTAWSGAPSETDVLPDASAHLAGIRRLLFDGHYAEAQALTKEHLLGRPVSFGTNLPLPEVRIDYSFDDEPQSVTRALHLDTGLATATSASASAARELSRETFCSHVDRVIATGITSTAGHDGLGDLDLAVSFGPSVIPARLTVESGDLVLTGSAHEILHSDGTQGTDLEIRIRVLASPGTVEPEGNTIRVKGARSATVLIAVGTSWGGADPRQETLRHLDAAAGLPFAQLRERHTGDHRALMDRVSIDLGASNPALRALPTDERRLLLAEGGDDAELLSLYFGYGRYLTIAGSREDSPLPLALQGLWNDGLASSASWTNDFHIDMNTQQNYWAAEITGLAECHEPLLRLVERLRISGRSTAERLYGAPGWVAHTVTNAWGYSAPGRGLGWGMHVTGGAWVALHLWEHYEYSGDRGFLRERAYPVFREAAEFFLAYLVEHPGTGWLVTGPSDSPENWYLSPEGVHCAVSMGPTVDRVFVDAVFRICLESAAILGLAGDFEERLREARAKLPPFQIGRHGQLQEWLHDFDEAIPSHRHTSHLCALYPERQITPRDTPELAQAARVTIDRRQAAPGWEQTEWVEANMMVYFARLLDGDLALEHLRNLISDASEANLLTFSAGGVAGAAQNIYSFDGNAGGTAGIAEMLVQSTVGEIELLPALPSTWSNGSVSGLRARGGITVDVAWQDGRLSRAVLRSDRAAVVRVRSGDELATVQLDPGIPSEIA